MQENNGFSIKATDIGYSLIGLNVVLLLGYWRSYHSEGIDKIILLVCLMLIGLGIINTNGLAAQNRYRITNKLLISGMMPSLFLITLFLGIITIGYQTAIR